MDSARICRYFWLNLIVPRGSIGINCYSPPPRRRAFYSKFQHTSHLTLKYLTFFRISEKIKLHFDYFFKIWYISIEIRNNRTIYQIMTLRIKSFLFISMHTRFLRQLMDAKTKLSLKNLFLLKKFHTILKKESDR